MQRPCVKLFSGLFVLAFFAGCASTETGPEDVVYRVNVLGLKGKKAYEKIWLNWAKSHKFLVRNLGQNVVATRSSWDKAHSYAKQLSEYLESGGEPHLALESVLTKYESIHDDVRKKRYGNSSPITLKAIDKIMRGSLSPRKVVLSEEALTRIPGHWVPGRSAEDPAMDHESGNYVLVEEWDKAHRRLTVQFRGNKPGTSSGEACVLILHMLADRVDEPRKTELLTVLADYETLRKQTQGFTIEPQDQDRTAVLARLRVLRLAVEGIVGK